MSARSIFDWERFIPFVPLAIFPYMSIDLFLFFSPLLCRDIAELRTHAKRMFLAITLAAVCFLLFPLRMGTGRPEVNGVSGMLFALLGGFDKPYNLVPSLHIALLCILWVVYSRHAYGLIRLLIQTWFILIAISCLVTNQHHVMDLVGGYILGVICLYLAPDVEPNEQEQSPTQPENRVGNRKVAWNYAAGAAALASCAIMLYPWGLILLWPAISGALVSLAYFRIDVGIFRKRQGRLPWSSRVILLPYLLVSRLFHMHLKRRCDPYCEIAPGVWIGGRLSRSQARDLAARGISAVLDLTAECSEAPALIRLRYMNLQILDLTPPTVAELQAGVAFMRENSRDGVYLHCALGVSRSVCVLAAFLISAKHAETVDQSMELIRARRPVARLHQPQRHVLEAYRRMLLLTAVK